MIAGDVSKFNFTTWQLLICMLSTPKGREKAISKLDFGFRNGLFLLESIKFNR